MLFSIEKKQNKTCHVAFSISYIFYYNYILSTRYVPDNVLGAGELQMQRNDP